MLRKNATSDYASYPVSHVVDHVEGASRVKREARISVRRWHALAALATALLFAGVPKPAVPLSAHEAAAPARVDDVGAAADAVAVEAVLRLTRDASAAQPITTT
jgi:hypothetical protein